METVFSFQHAAYVITRENTQDFALSGAGAGADGGGAAGGGVGGGAGYLLLSWLVLCRA